MVSRNIFRPVCVAIAIAAFAVWSSQAQAAERAGNSDKSDDVKVVEMFAGMELGDIDVKFIPKSSKSATVLIENKLDKPVRVKLPEAFAGVPVLAQPMDGGDMGGGMGGMGGGGGGMQGMGGGMGGMGMGMGGMGGGMGMGGMGMGGFGMFDVRPGRVGKIKVTTVCLEHGEKEPNPRVDYKIVPIEEFTQKPEVIEICKMLGHREMKEYSATVLKEVQQAAQAATWHYADGMSWDALRVKVGATHIHGPNESYFTMTQLRRGQVIAVRARNLASENPAYKDTDKEFSLSNQ